MESSSAWKFPCSGYNCCCPELWTKREGDKGQVGGQTDSASHHGNTYLRPATSGRLKNFILPLSVDRSRHLWKNSVPLPHVCISPNILLSWLYFGHRVVFSKCHGLLGLFILLWALFLSPEPMEHSCKKNKPRCMGSLSLGFSGLQNFAKRRHIYVGS